MVTNLSDLYISQCCCLLCMLSVEEYVVTLTPQSIPNYPTSPTWCACNRHARLLHSSSRAGSCCADSASSSNHRSNHGKTLHCHPGRSCFAKNGKSWDYCLKMFKKRGCILLRYCKYYNSLSTIKASSPSSLPFKGASK